MNHPELQTVAKRVVWFKAPDDALKDVKLFLAHVMTYGTLGDITTTLRYFSEDDFEAVLHDPPQESLIAAPGLTGTCVIVTIQFHPCQSEHFRYKFAKPDRAYL